MYTLIIIILNFSILFLHQTSLSFYHLPRHLGPKNSVKPTTFLNDNQQSSPFPLSFLFQGLIEKTHILEEIKECKHMYPPVKLTCFAPENGCLKDDSFILGPGLFFRVSSLFFTVREGKRPSLGPPNGIEGRSLGGSSLSGMYT